MMAQQKNKPLHGIKVVEFSTYVAAPVCARMLADMGAEVIKIESFHGDPWRENAKSSTFTGDEENPVFDIYNAGKKSICLDLKHPDGMAVLLEMLKDTDVFITNIRPKSLKKLKLDYESIRPNHPQMIYGTITGYGSKGPDADSPGFDTVAYWTRSGFLMDMAVKSEGSYPILCPTGVGDSITGGMLYGGIMTALFNRERTGEGEYVTASLYNTGIWTLASMIIQAQDRYHVRFPKERWEASPFGTAYRCADGEWVSISVLDYGRFQKTVFRILDIEEEMAGFDVGTPTKMKQQSRQIIPILERAFLKKTSKEWVAELKAADIVCSVLNHMNDVSKDEQAVVNQFVQEYTFPTGATCMLPCPPIRLASQPAPLAVHTPGIGEDTREILGSMGYTEAQINELTGKKAIR